MRAEETKALEFTINEVRGLLKAVSDPAYQGAPIIEGLFDTLMAHDREMRAQKTSGKLGKGAQLVKARTEKPTTHKDSDKHKVSSWTSRDDLSRLQSIKGTSKARFSIGQQDPFDIKSRY